MIVRTVEDLKTHGSYREKPGVWSSARYLLRRDGMGFTLTHTTIAAGSSQTMQYKNHVEGNLVTEGEGDLTDLDTGTVHRSIWRWALRFNADPNRWMRVTATVRAPAPTRNPARRMRKVETAR